MYLSIPNYYFDTQDVSINSNASIYDMFAEIQDTEYLCYYLSFPTQYVKLDIIFLTNNI